MSLVSSSKKLTFHNFKGGNPRVPILFFKNKKESLYEEDAILDTGANLITIPEYIFKWFKNESYKIIETKDKITGQKIWIIKDVYFKIGDDNKYIIYENEEIYYAHNPHIRVTSVGIKPVFNDFDVKIKARIKTIILDSLNIQ